MSWKVTVDLKEVKRATRSATKKADGLGALMQTLARDVVSEEESTRRYSDRTGDLDASTFAMLREATPATTTVTIEMGESPRARLIPYATFITDGTYGRKNTTYESLSDFKILAGEDFPKTLRRVLWTYFVPPGESGF